MLLNNIIFLQCLLVLFARFAWEDIFHVVFHVMIYDGISFLLHLGVSLVILKKLICKRTCLNDCIWVLPFLDLLFKLLSPLFLSEIEICCLLKKFFLFLSKLLLKLHHLFCTFNYRHFLLNFHLIRLVHLKFMLLNVIFVRLSQSWFKIFLFFHNLLVLVVLVVNLLLKHWRFDWVTLVLKSILKIFLLLLRSKLLEVISLVLSFGNSLTLYLVLMEFRLMLHNCSPFINHA